MIFVMIVLSEILQFTLSHVVSKPRKYFVKFDSSSFVLNFPQILDCEELEYRSELPPDGVREEGVILDQPHHLLGPFYQTEWGI